MTVGYIGASGLMGHGMAKNLIAKGQKLAITVHKQRDRVKDLLDAGATLADNAAALGATCDIVLICVTGSPQVEAVVAGPDGLLSKPKAGLIIVDCSTSEPHSTTHLRELAHSKGFCGGRHNRLADEVVQQLDRVPCAWLAHMENVFCAALEYRLDLGECGLVGADHDVQSTGLRLNG